ncbi:hypothetical protein F441_02656 [Phytophthora nicotianae CJ01A1]|uniref:SRP9 domain-containing protein n=6 Tax=Phytophthora nicotianae TaxID=4792 RepID=W2PF68_PHYN3|nr:hypothetical protein PPTG_19357 [Phytophthora nicotianae INRA-310]ETI54488.1 hypothetical protein F443_02695 [Phytophthora nicotianae P1569]ETK94358.1 hypothetical protein L915_02570 [Phytophthora nicotianae]ETO83239.1 hypothetical protein F444_02698 [Phytophthora nicotianae P1976]ETP24314.1 hypothetical protein F441_02656 [Phytophthora nicotianae CJ01A1]ETP52300.1 hypothetical protein F442_02659 [Phytophthora nicotianae P10297]
MAGQGNVSWERFEEQTKLAFVGDPLNSRFFLKTRVTAKKGVKVVARVSHHSTKPTPASPRSAAGRNEAVKYTTTDTSNLFRLTRLLRFVMQEVLGPMKTLLLPPSTAPLSPTSKPTGAPVAAAQAEKKKSKKKKKGKK